MAPRLFVVCLLSLTFLATGAGGAQSEEIRVALVSDDRILADMAREILPGRDSIGGIWVLPAVALQGPPGASPALAEARRLAKGGGFSHLVVLEHRTVETWIRPALPELNPFAARLAGLALRGKRVETRLDLHLFDIASGRILTWFTEQRTRELPLALVLGLRSEPVKRRQLEELLVAAGGAMTGVLPGEGEALEPLYPPLTVERIRDDPYWNAPRPTTPTPPWTPTPLVGTGDRWEHLEGERHVQWWKDALDSGVPLNAHGMWVTRGFERSWFGRAELEELNEAGLTPVLMFYYFGDDVSQETVSARYEDYRLWLQSALSHMACDVPVLVVLEPEFNNVPPNGDAHVKDWAPFAELMIRSAAEVRRFLPNARVGLCPGDYRAYDLWGVLGAASKHMDFLAFQELWASTRQNWMTADYQDVTSYALLFTTYLQVVFERPVLLAYLGVSSYVAEGSQDWEEVQAKVWRDLTDDLDRFRASGLFGVLAFAWYDDPVHTGYFGPAETRWGLVERTGRRKPGFDEFARLARRLLP